MEKIQEQFIQKLLVEGNNDQHVVWNLCAKLGLEKTFDVIDCGSIERVLKQIPVRIKQADIETLGIIVDADENIAQRWQQVKNILKKEGFSVGDLPENGLILQKEDKIKIGVWIMPNNNLNGMVEDFITFLVPKEDKLLPIVENHLNQIEAKGLKLYKDIHRQKTKIHAWLALQEEAGKPLGQAITANYLTTDEETCQKFINWLNRLFNT